MPRTKVRGVQIVSDSVDSDIIKQGSVSRSDLNTTTVGGAVVAKLVQGTGITISSTGADSGTGDVTINATATVTSVGLSLPNIFTVSGSPVTSSGTLTAVLASQTANTFLAAPSGSAGTPSFRAIVAADIPTLNQNTTGFATTLNYEDNRVISPSEGTANRLRFGFTSWANNNTSPYADFLHMRSYQDSSGGSDNLVMFRKDAIGMRIWQQTYGSATAYATFKDVAWTDGTNATGTWSISTSGSAATLTTARTINGTSFNGSANITTSTWGTARTITIGNTGKSVNGSANVAWTLTEIGAESIATLNTPRANLGDPTVREMALFDSQYNNKTEFHPLANIWVETSTDNVTWTDASPTDTQKRRLFGGDINDSNLAIPNGTPYFRIRVRANNYVYLNALYMYFSGQGHSTQVQIFKKHDNDASWTAHTSSAVNVSGWPAHIFLPFSSTIAFNPSAASGQHWHEVYALFIPTWNPTYPSNNIIFYRMQWWGGYPAGKRNLYSTDEFGSAFFPNAVSATTLTSTVSTGTAPFTVTSTTRVNNLNVATAGTADTWTTARTLTIGSTGKSVDGSANVSWTLAEIGAAAATGATGYIQNQTASAQTADFIINGNGTAAQFSTSSFDSTTSFGSRLTSAGSLTISIPTSFTGGWARGITYATAVTGTIVAGVGALGSNTTTSLLYLAHGTSPWSSGSGLYVLPSGNVGVGTTSPSALLDVVGSARFSSATSTGTVTFSSSTGAGGTLTNTATALTLRATGDLNLGSNNTDRINIKNTGVVSISTLMSGGTAPSTTGTTRMVITDANGQLSFANIPTGTGTVTSIVAGTGLTGGTITTSGTIAIDQGAQIVSTRANSTTTGAGQIYLNGTTGNRIDFNTNGVAAPAFTTRSVGTKIVLYPSLSGSNMDYALGINAQQFWLSVPGNVDSDVFSFYGGTTEALRVTGAGRIRTRAGTALLPAISPGLDNSSDLDTGIYFPAADTIAFAEGGIEVMRIESSARVAIGTTSATARLQVKGTGATSASTALRVENSSGTAALEVMDDGQLRVGAGTASLPVISAGLNSSDTNTGIYFPATDAIALATNGTRRLRADATGVGVHVDPTDWIHLSTGPSDGKYLNIDASQNAPAPFEFNPSGGGNSVAKLYGPGNDANALGTPHYWMEIKLDGQIVLIPCYEPFYP